MKAIHQSARRIVLACALAGAVSPLSAQVTVDHSDFDALLKAHVRAGAVDYDAFGKSTAFTRYVASLEKVRPESLGEQERLAFWINSYNAFTIQLITSTNERESIKNINKSFGFLKLKGPWSEKIVRAGGQLLTLDEVEHGLIRKQFAEPRIHFALVCAAIGCPPLRSEAYVGSRLNDQLEDQGKSFILRSPTKNQVDVDNRAVYVSSIFIWYKKDFGGSDRALGQYLAKWYAPGVQRTMLESGQFKLVETDYDWTLNSQKNMK